MDKITKVLLAIIAIGLLMNAVNPWVRPVKAEAAVLQDNYEVVSILEDISLTLSSISLNLSSMESDTSSMERYLGKISRGTCTGPVCD